MQEDKVLPYGHQDITEEDIAIVSEVLRSDYLTQGPRIAEFEQNFCAYIGAKYGAVVSNGTAALHLAMMALGVKSGDKVITTPITFAASANCVRYCGGEITFADIDPKTYLISLDSVRSILEKSPKGTYKGIIVVDFAGNAVNLEAFRQLADEYQLWLVEDACHSPGGFFIDSKGEKQFCGNGKFADISAFSFHPVKHIAAGEGGALTTNSKELFDRISSLRTHGITKDHDKYENSIELAGGEDDYPLWYMEMQELGYNYRITDMQAALANSQLKKATPRLARRRAIAKKYSEAFAGEDFVLGQSGYVEGHAYHLYVLEVKNRLGLYNYLRKHKIYAQIHYVPTHLMPYYKKEGWKPGDLPKAEDYYRHCISIPMYPTLTDEDVERVITTIKQFNVG